MATATKQRIKSQAATFPVPQNSEQCDAAIARIGELQLERVRIHADKDEQLAAINREHEQRIEPLNREILALAAGVQGWCEANRFEITRHGKVKFATFPSGDAKWRLRPPKVTLRAIDRLLEILPGRGLGRFIRTKQEINKEAILAEPDAVKGIIGITIEQGEDFIIEPFQTKLEEII